MNPTRRSTLRRLSRCAALLAAGRVFAGPDLRLPTLGTPHFDTDPFTLGVASGQPRPHGVVLWTRLAPQPQQVDGGMPGALIPVHWQVAEDARFGRLVQSGTVLADPTQAHSVRVRIDHLAPARTYHYRFLAGNATSPVGRTRTAPAEQAEVARLRLALASCQHYEQGWFAVHREIAAADVDLVLFVGDYIYEGSRRRYRVRPHETTAAPVTLTQYRQRYATYKADPDLQAAHAAHPWILAWDDHEVRNDYAGPHGDEDLDPEIFVAIRANAYQAYFEHQPLDPDQLPGPQGMRMHDHFRWGRLAELWTLDGRQYRSVQGCNRDDQTAGGHLRWRCAELADERRTMLGHAQEEWLHAGLRTATARWKLVGQATQISAWGVRPPLGRPVVYTDGWDGYPQARARMLARLGHEGIDNVVFLGGDVHRHVAANLRVRPNDPASPVVASEFVTTSVTTAGMPGPALSLIRRSNPDILHARSDERGFMEVTVTPDSVHCIARATDFPVLPHSRLRTQAHFRVMAGHPGIQPVP